MLKDKYTTKELKEADPEKEAAKTEVTKETYAILDANDEKISAMERLRQAVING